jgi:acyl-CoA thioesterase
MDEKVREAIFQKMEKEPFTQKFGIKLLELGEGYSKVGMKFTPDMENFLGMAHGGALFPLIDEAFETASNSHGTVAVALNMNITYISPLPQRARLLSRRENSAGLKGRLSMISSCLMIKTI